MKSILRRTWITLILTILSCLGCAQTWYEDFEQGYPTGGLAWQGDTADFRINSSGQLQLNRVGAGTSTIHTPIHYSSEMAWTNWVKVSFNTSANNYGALILFEDTNGSSLFVRLGGADDHLSIVQRTNGNDSILSTGLGITTSAGTHEFYLKAGLYGGILSLNSSPDSIVWNFECSVNITGFPSSGYTGLSCKVTSSNATKVRFDDFKVVHIVPDTVGPRIIRWEMPALDRIDIYFSEYVDSAGIQPSWFQCQGYFPSQLLWNPSSIPGLSLMFDDSLPDRSTLSLNIPALCDTIGNCTSDTSIYCHHFSPHYADVQVSEIMADPTPSVDLPESEYLELHNRTDFPVAVDGWTLKIEKNTIPLPQDSIKAHSFIILARQTDEPLWSNYERILFLPSLSLPNSGAEISLKDQNGRVIHSCRYAPSCWGDDARNEGGWSIERVDSLNNTEAGNWNISLEPGGGSPGRKNSIVNTVADDSFDAGVEAIPIGMHSFILRFNDQIDSTYSSVESELQISESIQVERVEWNSNHFDELKVILLQAMQPGKMYSIEGPALCDLNGNMMPQAWNALVAWPEFPDSGEIILNEVLFNASSEGEEFIEVYNASLKAVSLKHLSIAEYDTLNGVSLSWTPLCDEHQLIFPGQYRYISRNPEIVAEIYGQTTTPTGISTDGLPGLPDMGSSLSLMNSGGTILDICHYGPDMHHPALGDADGYSLERIHPSISSEIDGSWQSSAASGPGATPGFQNSMWTPIYPGAEEGEWGISPKVISPDLDGYNDKAILSWSGLEPNSLISVCVYDLQGRKVRILSEDLSVGPSGLLIWAGRDDYGKQLPEGIYVFEIRCELRKRYNYYRFTVAVAYH